MRPWVNDVTNQTLQVQEQGQVAGVFDAGSHATRGRNLPGAPETGGPAGVLEGWFDTIVAMASSTRHNS